jgi:hypothetical protein
MVTKAPKAPTGTAAHSCGGGRSGGAPSRNTGPATTPSRAKAADTRTTSLRPHDSTASPNAVVRPARTTDVRTEQGPTVPGRKKNPEITSGSGNGMTCPSARVQMASR